MVRRFLSLSPHRRRVLLIGIATLLTARLALWVMPFGVARRLLTPRVSHARPGRATPHDVRWALRHAQRLVPRATCLPQALAAERLLRRAALDAVLRIGVLKGADGSFEAHAWVETGGRIVVGALPPQQMARFTPLPPIPGETAR